ncbi:MAG: signal peptidase II [Candidatus Komeilibacteria bacterium]|nr:signal peptidase II [Candidatus Komeilibacteria bacterium]
MATPKGLIYSLTGLFIIDRVAKYLALSDLSETGLFCCQNLVGLRLHLNEGIAFGIPLPPAISIILAAVVIFVLIFYLYKNRLSMATYFGGGLIVIGAVSNLLDKIFHGAVVDFLELARISVINLSDVYILTGIVLLLTRRSK